MPLVNAKCTNCGANLNVDNAKDAAVCEFCGSAFIVEKAIQNYNYHITNNVNAQNVVITGKGNAEKERLLNNAKTNERFGDYEKAQSIYLLVTEDYPDDYRGWLGLALIKSENYSKVDVSSAEFESISNNIKKALICAPIEISTSIRLQWNDYASKYSSLINEQKEKAAKEELERKHKEAEKKRLEQEKIKKDEAEKIRKEKENEEKEKKKRIKKTIISTLTSILTIIANIIGIIYLFSSNISTQINNSPAIIGKILVLLLIEIIITTVFGVIGKIIYFFWMPCVISAIATIMMISGMLSHSPNVFLSIVVVVVFGGVGIGVSAVAYFIPRVIIGARTDY